MPRVVIKAEDGWNDRIIACRERLGLLQYELAERLGMGQPELSRWETGQTFPHYKNWKKLAAAFGVSDYWLRYGTDVRPPALLSIYLARPEQVKEITEEEFLRLGGKLRKSRIKTGRR